jgi:hypothetical protein
MQLSATVLFGLGAHPSFLLFLAQLTFVNLLEWSLATEFSATDEFLKKWADTQKLTYGKGAGWFVSHPFLFFLPPSIQDH